MMKTKFLVPIALVVGLLNGLFGAGGGTVIVPALDRHLPTRKAHATALAVMLPLSIVSAFVYVRGLEVNWPAVGWVSLGGAAGGLIGARLLNRISAGWLNMLFALFMAAAAMRMLFS